jgi:hypothetical protein
LSRNESGRFGALKSDSTHHFFRRLAPAPTKYNFTSYDIALSRLLANEGQSTEVRDTTGLFTINTVVTLEIQALDWYRHTNVAGLNRLIGSQPTPHDNWIHI